MRTQIVGFGVVGKAQAYLIRKLGHEVSVYDPYIIPESRIERDIDVTFICTMDDKVEEAVKALVDNRVSGLYVIKSTVPIGATVRLMKKYDVHISHNPEFLREKYAYEDVVNASRIVIGECCQPHGDLLEEFYRPLGKPVFRMNPTESEMVKLVSNALRAVSISFWNELYMLCQRIGLDVRVIAEAADPGKVLGEWEGGRWGTRFFGAPYGGKCLPKDVNHLISAFRDSGLASHILEATEKVNKIIKSLVEECVRLPSATP